MSTFGRPKVNLWGLQPLPLALSLPLLLPLPPLVWVSVLGTFVLLCSVMLCTILQLCLAFKVMPPGFVPLGPIRCLSVSGGQAWALEIVTF